MSFLSYCFQDFLDILCFQCFTMVYWDWIVVCVHLIWASWTSKLMGFLYKFRKIWPLFFSNIFFLSLSLPALPCGTPLAHILECSIWHHSSLEFCSFLLNIFLHFVHLGNVHWSNFNFTDFLLLLFLIFCFAHIISSYAGLYFIA